MKERKEVAVVTGAARGIGRRVALVLAEEGFRIVANDLAAPEETLEELRSAGARTLSVPGDVSDEAEVRVMAGAVMEERSEERRVGKECRSRWSPYH